MGRLFGIALILLGIWVGIEVYNEGTRNAFGGLFAFLEPVDPYAEQQDPEGTDPGAPVTKRAGRAWQRAYNRSESRVDEALAQPGAAER